MPRRRRLTLKDRLEELDAKLARAQVALERLQSRRATLLREAEAEASAALMAVQQAQGLRDAQGAIVGSKSQ